MNNGELIIVSKRYLYEYVGPFRHYYNDFDSKTLVKSLVEEVYSIQDSYEVEVANDRSIIEFLDYLLEKELK